MSCKTHDFVTADLLGLKAALVVRAQTERISVSAVVRRAVERELERVDASTVPNNATSPKAWSGPNVKLSIRLASSEARQLDAAARRADLSRGAFIAGLLAGVPSLSAPSSSRPDGIAALNASNAELSTLIRNLHHLTTLLRHGDVEPARQYRRMLDTLVDDVRAHLSLAASVLADLRPARASAVEPMQPSD